ncbi:hypothetical protein [Streptomyces virginiae]|uniref:hypothetical protein n=1 Tax=Streptomyces virginiae TaxID=1961 RepID=UPI0036563678
MDERYAAVEEFGAEYAEERLAEPAQLLVVRTDPWADPRHAAAAEGTVGRIADRPGSRRR